MSEETRPEDGAIPPRVTIKMPGQSGDMASSSDPANKKKTARLSLNQATAEIGATPGAPVDGAGIVSKTIRLAPAMTGQVSVSPLPSVGKALTGTLGFDDVKRQTSRISLENALQGGAPGGMGAIPKTIKVKRPSISMGGGATPGTGNEPAEVPLAAKNQTARVEVTPDMVPEAQQTQKKTIKIRRAESAGEAKAEPRSVTIARSEAAVGAGVQVAKPQAAFVWIAAAALMVMCFMLYVLAAQAFPNLGWSV